MSPSCFGLPGLTGSPASSWISASSRAARLREIAGEARQHLPVDRDAAPLHARQHRHQRPLQRLVDVGHVLGDQARLEHVPQPQRHVGVFGRVFGRLLDRHADRTSTCDLPVPATSPKLDGAVVEEALRQRRPCRARCVRHRAHRTSAWCRRTARTSMPRSAKICRSNLRLCAIFRTPRSSSSGFSQLERVALGDLVRRKPAVANRPAPPASPPCLWLSGT